MNFNDIPIAIRRKMREAVDRGANRLDSRRPRWYQQIDKKKLDIADGFDCVVGQLYGAYNSDALNKIIPWAGHNYSYTAAHKYGFVLPDGASYIYWNKCNRYLDRLWIAKINERLAADAKLEGEAA